MRFNKIILIQLLALEASVIKRDTPDENTTITTRFEKTCEKTCDWSWGKRHACAITGFFICFVGLPMCFCWCGRSDSVAGDSCAAGI